MADKEIAEAAQDLIDKHWDGRLPVDPYQIAKSAGFRVLGHEFGDDTVSATGFLNGQPTVLLSRSVHQHEPVRARWAVAHSLGFIVLHREQLKEPSLTYSGLDGHETDGPKTKPNT